jgi:hypothetical protein
MMPFVASTTTLTATFVLRFPLVSPTTRFIVVSASRLTSLRFSFQLRLELRLRFRKQCLGHQHRRPSNLSNFPRSDISLLQSDQVDGVGVPTNRNRLFFAAAATRTSTAAACAEAYASTTMGGTTSTSTAAAQR